MRVILVRCVPPLACLEVTERHTSLQTNPTETLVQLTTVVVVVVVILFIVTFSVLLTFIVLERAFTRWRCFVNYSSINARAVAIIRTLQVFKDLVYLFRFLKYTCGNFRLCFKENCMTLNSDRRYWRRVRRLHDYC